MIVYDIDKIYDYLIEPVAESGVHKWSGIGYSINDKMVCGIIWSEMTETNVWAHIRIDVPSREFLIEALRVLFIVHGLRRVTMPIYDNNYKAIALVKAMGAKLEYILKEGYGEGDVLIYVLWNDTGIVSRMRDRFNKELVNDSSKETSIHRKNTSSKVSN